jgi:Calcineurin-like phosphoesterase
VPDGAAVPDPRFVRAHDRNLSLWQSAVADYVRRLLGDRPSTVEVLAHPMMQAANDHVEAALSDRGAVPQPTPGDERQTAAYLSQLGLAKGVALIDGDAERADALDLEFRRYSDIDPGFLSVAITFVEYYLEHDGKLLYHDWKQQGKGELDYGAIKWTLPDNGVVGIIGDWGTGLEDAKELLREVMGFKPAAIIHLGDVYYSGTPRECQLNYADVIAEVFKETLPNDERIPVFNLAGNHDYYAFGYGFYPTLTTINHAIHDAEQAASYFCLRTADCGWQFLAMDTGYDDANPLDLIAPGAGPGLHTSEVEWLQDKLDTFPGVTVLLSHNQLFSAHATLNDGPTPYLNTFLQKAFTPYFTDKVAAWLWGHEHNFAAYRDGLFGLAKGRLIGCSAYEELTLAEPYAVNYPEVPYLDPVQYRLGSEGDYYDHGYAIVDLSGRAQPSDPVSISYHQFPSWGRTPPRSPESKLIFSESLARPTMPVSAPVSLGS